MPRKHSAKIHCNAWKHLHVVWENTDLLSVAEREMEIPNLTGKRCEGDRTASAWRPIFIPKQMGVQLQTSHTSAHNTNNFYIRNTSNIHLLVVWLATAHSLPVPIVTTVLHWRLLWCTGYNRIPVFDLLSHDTVWSFEKTLRILQFLGISPVCLLTYWSKW